MPCPGFNVSLGHSTSFTSSWKFGEWSEFDCDYGYLTPKKTTGFNVTCGFNDTVTLLEGLTYCEGGKVIEPILLFF